MVALHYTVSVPEDPPAPRSGTVLRRLTGSVGRVLGEGALCAATCALALFVAYPHFWWLIRSYTLVRVSDVYRPGDYGGTLFLIARALEGETGHSSTLLSYPEGFAFGGDFTNQWMTDGMAVLVSVLGMPLGYNLSLVGMLVSNGLAVYLVARLLRAKPIPALVGAAVATMSPLIAEEILSGRPVTAWWAPAVAASALCVAAIGSWRRLALAIPGIACLVLSLKVYAYGPVILLPWTVLAGIAALWPLDPWKPVRALIVLAAAAGMSWWAVQVTLDVGPSGYLVEMPSLKRPAMALRDVLDLGRGGENYLRIPAGTLLVAAVASLLGWRKVLSWLPLALAAVLLVSVSLGASLNGRGALIEVDPRMPYTWLMERVHWLWGCPRPSRYGMPGALLLAAWMAVALSALWHLRRRFWLPIGVGLSLHAALVMGLQVHQTDEFERYPAWPPLPQLEELEGQRVLLDVPLTFRGDKTLLSMVAYVRVPRLNPPSAKYPPWRDGLDPQDRPLLYALARIHAGEDVPEEVTALLYEGPPEVIDLGLRKVVVHRSQMDRGARARYEALLTGMGATLSVDDDWLGIYDLPSY